MPCDFTVRQLQIIINNLAVVPTGKTADKNIAKSIAEAMERNVLIPTESLDINVGNGNVILSGSVPGRQAKRAAFFTAAYTRGVTSVENRIEVSWE